MIIFYDKTTGNIVGTIEGRLHNNDHLSMWIGDKKTVDRLIINWVKNESDEMVPESNSEIIRSLENGATDIKDYKVDLQSYTLIDS